MSSLFLESVKDVEGLLCLLTDKIDQDVVNAAVNLKTVATMSVGFDHLGIYQGEVCFFIRFV